jgi:hypothetical protein
MLYFMTTQDYSVTSGRRERSPPSLSTLCGHPRHCDATPGTMTTSAMLLKRTGTRRRHARHCTTYGFPLTPLSNRPAGGGRTANHYATTLDVTPIWARDLPRHPNMSKIRLGSRQLRDTARHAFARKRIVRHACKLPSPWPIKGGAIPQPYGGEDRDERHSHAFRLSLRHWHLPQSIPLGPGGPASFPASLVTPLCKHHGATQYSALSTPLLDVRPRSEPG